MRRLLIGLMSLFLLLSVTGCATSRPALIPPAMCQAPDVPGYMLKPLPPPAVEVEHNRDLLQLLADYEALRIRFNADRIGTAMILQHSEQFTW